MVSAAGGSGERQPWDVRRFAETVLYFNPLPTPDQVLRRLFGGAQASPAPAMASSAASGAVQTLIAPSGGAGTTAPQPTVLVTGATGGVGKRVVAQLLQRPGARVRALVRDAQKGRQLLGALPAAPGARLELVAADLTQPRTLLPEMFEGVGSVVACSAVKVRGRPGWWLSVGWRRVMDTRQRAAQAAGSQSGACAAWCPPRDSPPCPARQVAPKEGDTVDRQKYYQVGRPGAPAPPALLRLPLCLPTRPPACP